MELTAYLVLVMTFFTLIVPQRGALAISEKDHSETCTVESCRELQERVQRLEEVVKVIVHALAIQKHEPFEAIDHIINRNLAGKATFDSSGDQVKPNPAKPTADESPDNPDSVEAQANSHIPLEAGMAESPNASTSDDEGNKPPRVQST